MKIREGSVRHMAHVEHTPWCGLGLVIPGQGGGGRGGQNMYRV